jgi:protein phosphatase
LAGVCRLDVGGATSPGRVRDRNEDSFLIQQLSWCNRDRRHEFAVVVVADGVGGHEAGDEASDLVIRTASGALTPLLTGALTGQFKDTSASVLADTIEYALQEANRTVFRKASAQGAAKGMGATAAVVLLWEGQALIGHVGDCRVYHVVGGQLIQVTRDQTLVARMVELGQLSPQEALAHPSRNEVTEAIGRRFDLKPARYEAKLAPGDWLIVACDGLHAHVNEALLAETIRSAAPSAALLAHQLVELANQRGGSDNCTVVVVRGY